MLSDVPQTPVVTLSSTYCYGLARVLGDYEAGRLQAVFQVDI